MPTVYVVNKGGHDYSRAERFGRLVYCSEGLVAKHDVSQMLRVILDKMEHSDPTDYILLTSLASLCSIACSVFALKHHRLNLLLFKDGDYIERQLILTTTQETQHAQAETQGGKAP